MVQTCALLREKSLLSALLLALVQALDLVLTGEKLPALILAGKHVPTLNLTLTLTLVLTRENVPALVLILTLILVLILALTQILTREDVSTLAEASLLASLLLLAAKGPTIIQVHFEIITLTIVSALVKICGYIRV